MKLMIKLRKVRVIPKEQRLRWVMANQKVLWQAGWFLTAFERAFWPGGKS